MRAKVRRAGVWLKWWSTCCASASPELKTQVLPKSLPNITAVAFLPTNKANLFRVRNNIDF
jgi:hypothetical protein